MTTATENNFQGVTPPPPFKKIGGKFTSFYKPAVSVYNSRSSLLLISELQCVRATHVMCKSNTCIKVQELASVNAKTKQGIEPKTFITKLSPLSTFLIFVHP